MPYPFGAKEFKLPYVLYSNDLNIINVHNTEMQNNICVLSTQKSTWKMQEIKLMQYRFCKLRSAVINYRSL